MFKTRFYLKLKKRFKKLFLHLRRGISPGK